MRSNKSLEWVDGGGVNVTVDNVGNSSGVRVAYATGTGSRSAKIGFYNLDVQQVLEGGSSPTGRGIATTIVSGSSSLATADAVYTAIQNVKPQLLWSGMKYFPGRDGGSIAFSDLGIDVNNNDCLLIQCRYRTGSSSTTWYSATYVVLLSSLNETGAAYTWISSSGAAELSMYITISPSMSDITLSKYSTQSVSGQNLIQLTRIYKLF